MPSLAPCPRMLSVHGYNSDDPHLLLSRPALRPYPPLPPQPQTNTQSRPKPCSHMPLLPHMLFFLAGLSQAQHSACTPWLPCRAAQHATGHTQRGAAHRACTMHYPHHPHQMRRTSWLHPVTPLRSSYGGQSTRERRPRPRKQRAHVLGSVLEALSVGPTCVTALPHNQCVSQPCQTINACHSLDKQALQA